VPRTTLIRLVVSLLILGAASSQAASPPPVATFSQAFAGSVSVKGEGFKTSQPYSLQVNFDAAELSFLAMDVGGTLYSGHMGPRGRSRHSLALFLDGDSNDALATDAAARAASASNRSAGRVLGGSSRLVVTVKENGSVSLKIRSEVLVDGMGTVVLKANLTPTDAAPPAGASTLARAPLLDTLTDVLADALSAVIKSIGESLQNAARK
jgi:hypothetical protein